MGKCKFKYRNKLPFYILRFKLNFATDMLPYIWRLNEKTSEPMREGDTGEGLQTSRWAKPHALLLCLQYAEKQNDNVSLH